MSITENNITEEEKISGYNPNEAGDETFALEQLDSYPGVLPDFTYIKEPIIPSESSFQDDDEIEESNSEEDFGDLNEDVEDYDEANFDFGDGADNSDSIEEPSSNIPISGAFEDSDDTFDSFSEYSEDDSIDDDSDKNTDLNDDSGIEKLSDEEIRILEGNADNDIKEKGLELDDALKGLVESELQRSSERSTNDFSFDEYQEFVPKDGFPIDEDMSANVMNFNDIDADKPSNFGINKLTDEDENKKKEEVKEENIKPEKKKSKKKMIYIYSGVAASLLITLLTIAIFNKDTLVDNDGSGSDSTLVDNKLEDGINSKSISKKKNKEKDKNNDKDLAKVTEKDNSKSISDQVNSNTETKNEVIVDENIAKNETHKINLPKIEEKVEKPNKISSASPKFKSGNTKEIT